MRKLKNRNIFKYIFILVVIGLIVYSIYLLSGNNQKNGNEQIIEEEKDVIEKITNLRLGIASFDTLNPLISKNKEVQNISKLIFEPLLKITQDYKIEPCLAKEYSKIGTNSYIIKLKDEIFWQNGEKFSANDVKFTIEQIKNIDSIYSTIVEPIENIEIVDAETIKLDLTKEIPFFEYYLTFPILCKNNYEGEDFATTSKMPIGIGQFLIEEETENQIELKRNENYWDKEKTPILDSITITKFGSMGEEYNAFKIGNIDLVNTRNNKL